jgi:hypothetical protein
MNTKLNAALVAAIAELRNVQKDKTNPHFKSKFASLDAIIDATRPVLAKNGLAIVQLPEYDSDSHTAGVVTRVIHSSGECIESKLLLPVKSNDPMACGSAISYSRRYSISAVLMICADEDDDGVSASTPSKAVTKPVIAKPEFFKKPSPAPVLPQNAIDMLFSMMDTNKVTEDEVRSFCLSKGMKDVPEFISDLPEKIADRLLSIFPEVIEFSLNK